MNRAERLLKSAAESLAAASKLVSRSDTVDKEDYQRMITAANQATQAAAELNQIVGMLTASVFKD